MPQNRLVMCLVIELAGIPGNRCRRATEPCDANSDKMTYYIIVARAYARIMAGTYE